VRLEGLGQLKNPITSSGIEPVTIWLVAGQEFCLPHVVQIGSGSHPMGSPGVTRPGREADHSPPTSAEVKKTWIYT
jgi:hypothetical protein